MRGVNKNEVQDLLQLCSSHAADVIHESVNELTLIDFFFVTLLSFAPILDLL